MPQKKEHRLKSMPVYSIKALTVIGVILLFAPAVYWHFVWGASIGVAVVASTMSWVGIGFAAFAALCVAFIGGLMMVGLPPLLPGGIMSSDSTISKVVGLIFALLLFVVIVDLFLGSAYDWAYVSVANELFGTDLGLWNLGLNSSK